MSSLFKIPISEQESRNGLYHGSRFRRFSAGIAPAASAPILRANHAQIGVTAGGGSSINNVIDVSFQTSTLVAGDLIFVFVNSQWGCSNTPLSTPISITDPVGNIWKNAASLYIDTLFYSIPGGAAGFKSKFMLDCLWTIHKGGALPTITIQSALDPNAWDVQAVMHISAFGVGGASRIPKIVESANQFNINNPSLPNMKSNTNRSIIFASVCPSNGAAFNGASAPQFGGINVFAQWYILLHNSAAKEVVTPLINLTTGNQVDLQSIALLF